MEKQASRPVAAVLQSLWRAAFLVSLPFGLLSFILPVYGTALGATPFGVGLIISSFAAANVAVRPIFGSLADRLARKPLVAAALLGYGAAWVSIALARTYWGLAASRIIQGAASALLWVVAYAIVADESAGDERGRNAGLLEAWTHRGEFVGGLAGWVVFLLAIATGRSNEAGAVSVTFGMYAAAAAWAAVSWLRGPSPVTVAPRRPGVGLIPATALRTGLFGVVLLASAALTMSGPLTLIFSQQAISRNVLKLAPAYMPVSVVMSILPARFGRMADAVGRRKLLFLGTLVAAGGILAIPFARSLIALAVLLALHNAGVAAFLPAQNAAVADVTPEGHRGRGYGLYQSAAGLGAIIGPPLGTCLYRPHAVVAPFGLAACIFLLAGLLGLAAVPEKQRNS